MPFQEPRDINFLRSFPQSTDLYMVIQQPQHREGASWAGYLWSGRVTAAPGAADPIYSLAVTSNNALTLIDGLTVFIGSTEYGSWDRGVVRLHGDQTIGAGAETLYIAVSSDLRNVQIDDYVVVLDSMRLWSRFPYSEGDASSVTFYKDYGYFRDSLGALGLTWDQLGADDTARAEASMPPIPVVGPHAVRFIESGGDAEVYFDFSDSQAQAPGNAITAWASSGEDGGAGWVDNVEVPGFKTYSEISGLAGFRTTLEVSDGSSTPVEFRRGVRYVFTLRRPGESEAGDPDNAEPIVNFDVISMQGDFASGYWTAQVRVWGSDASQYIILPGALVLFFADDAFSAEDDYLTIPGVDGCIGPIYNRENHVLAGRITDGSIRQDAETGDVTFQVHSYAQQAQARENYSVPIVNEDTATDWYETPSLTVGRAAWWFWVWHSTMPLITDVYLSGLSQSIRAHEFVVGDLLQGSVASFLQARRRAKVLFDRYGRLKMVSDADLTPYGTADTLFTLGSSDWINEVTMFEVEETPSSFLDGGGVAYAAGTATPYLCSAPGSFSKYRGRPSTEQALAVDDQDELNTLIGRALASENAQYTALVPMAGNWRVGDIWPQEVILVSVETERKTFTRERFFLRGIQYEYDRRAGCLLTTFSLRIETDGTAAVTIPIEPTLPITVEPGDTTTPEEPPTPGVTDTGSVIVATDVGVYYCDDVDNTPPVWSAAVAGLPAGQEKTWHLGKDLHHWYGGIPSECYLWGIFGNRPQYVYKREGFPGGTWQLVFDATAPRWGLGPNSRVGSFCFSPKTPDMIYTLAGFWDGGFTIGWAAYRTVNGGASYSYRGPVDGSMYQDTGTISITWNSLVASYTDADQVWALVDRFVSQPRIYRTQNGGFSWTQTAIGGNSTMRGVNRFRNIYGSDQTLIYTEQQVSNGNTPQYSSDGGASFSSRSPDPTSYCMEFSTYSATIWAALMSDGLVYTTTNAGINWTLWKNVGTPESGSGALFTWTSAGVLSTVVMWYRWSNQLRLHTTTTMRDITGNLVTGFGVSACGKILRNGNISYREDG